MSRPSSWRLVSAETDPDDEDPKEDPEEDAPKEDPDEELLMDATEELELDWRAARASATVDWTKGVSWEMMLATNPLSPPPPELN